MHDEIAEVLVVRHEDPALLAGVREYGAVRLARQGLGRVRDVVPLGAEPSDEPRMDVLVREEPHRVALPEQRLFEADDGRG